jgi:hypothetical protein
MAGETRNQAQPSCYGCVMGWPRGQQQPDGNYWHTSPESGSEYLCTAWPDEPSAEEGA